MTTEERVKQCLVKALWSDSANVQQLEFGEKQFANRDEGISADATDRWNTVGDIVHFVEAK